MGFYERFPPFVIMNFPLFLLFAFFQVEPQIASQILLLVLQRFCCMFDCGCLGSLAGLFELTQWGLNRLGYRLSHCRGIKQTHCQNQAFAFLEFKHSCLYNLYGNGQYKILQGSI